eukprot:365313-Chlamydomonas_euryale.AAC.4
MHLSGPHPAARHCVSANLLQPHQGRMDETVTHVRPRSRDVLRLHTSTAPQRRVVDRSGNARLRREQHSRSCVAKG